MSLRPKCILDVQGVARLAIICAWCPDKAAGDAWAEDRGLDSTHGICLACETREFPFMAEARKAKTEGRAPCYVLGEHNLPNGRKYRVTDTGFPLATMDGKTEVGGYIVEGDGESLRFATSLAVAAYLEGAKGLPRVYAEALL